MVFFWVFLDCPSFSKGNMESSHKNKGLLVKYDQLLALCLFSEALGIPALQTILINRSDSLWTSAFDNLQFRQTKNEGEKPQNNLLVPITTGSSHRKYFLCGARVQGTQFKFAHGQSRIFFQNPSVLEDVILLCWWFL